MLSALEHRRGLRTAAIFAGLVLVLLAARYDRLFRTPMLELGDIAVNALQVDNAKHFTEIYGNYSRFEFNHPGPAFFYVYAVSERVLFDWLHLVPSPANAQLIGSIALQAFFFALAIGLLGTYLRWPALPPLAVLAGVLYFGVQAEPFVSIWPPHVLLMPFLCFLVACVSVAAGRTNDWPWVILAGGFLFHGHVAQPLFVGGLGALAFGLWLRQMHVSAGGWRGAIVCSRRRLVVSVALAALFCLPLAIDVLAWGRHSNVATIAGRFSVNSEEHITIGRSLLYFLSFGTAARDQHELFATFGPEARAFLAANAWRIALWLVVMIAPAIIAGRSRTWLRADERRFVLLGGVFLAASVLGCLAWGKAQAGGMYHFNGYFYYAIYFFALLLALGLATRLLPRFPWFATAGAAVLAGGIGLSLFHAGTVTEGEAGLPVKSGVTAALAAGGTARPKLLVFEHAQWPSVAAVALELQRRHVPFYVGPWWDFMFERRHDLTRLGPAPEDAADIWWITHPDKGGYPITPDLAIHIRPGLIRPGVDAIRFPGDGNAFRYTISGLSYGNIEYAATNLPRLVLRFVPAPAATDVKLVFDAESASAPQPQAAMVYFNGEHVGEVVVTARATVAVRLPAAAWNRHPESTLELRFPQAEVHRLPQRPGYDWWSAWNLWSIRFESGQMSAVRNPIPLPPG